MTVETVAEDLRRLIDDAVVGVSSDLEAVVERQGPYHQRFTPLIAAWSELAVCSSVVGLAAKYLADEGLDDATAVRLAHDLVGQRSKTLEVRYRMPDSARIMRAVSELLVAPMQREEGRAVVRLLQDYLHFVHHLIRTRVPWHELSVAYEGALAVKAAWSDWLGPKVLGRDVGAAFGYGAR